MKNLANVPHEKAVCALRSHHVYGRYLTQTPIGRLTLNRDKIKTEELVDGKFLVSSSDDTLSVEDIVLGCKAPWRVERAFRDLKHVLDIRPVYHRLSDRIRAHVMLCCAGWPCCWCGWRRTRRVRPPGATCAGF